MRLLVASLLILFTWSAANCHVIFLGFSYCLWTNKDVFFRVSIHVTYRKMIICSVCLQNSMNLSVPRVQDTSPNHLPLLLSMQDIQGLFLLSSLLCSWNYTGWLQVDSRASGIYSLWSFLRVLIILLSLVFYRLQIWLNEAMGTSGGGEQKIT